MKPGSDTEVEGFLNSFEQLSENREKETTNRMESLQRQVEARRRAYELSPKKNKVPPMIPTKKPILGKIYNDLVYKGKDTGKIELIQPVAREDESDKPTADKEETQDEIDTVASFVEMTEDDAEYADDGLDDGAPKPIRYDDVMKEKLRSDLPWQARREKEKEDIDTNKVHNVTKDEDKPRQSKKLITPSNSKKDMIQSKPTVPAKPLIYQKPSHLETVTKSKAEAKVVEKTAPKPGPKPTLKHEPVIPVKLHHSPHKAPPKLEPKPAFEIKLKPVIREKPKLQSKTNNLRQNLRHAKPPKPKPKPELEFLNKLAVLKKTKPEPAPKPAELEVVKQKRQLRKPKPGPKPKLELPEALQKRGHLSPSKRHEIAREKPEIPEAMQKLQQVLIRGTGVSQQNDCHGDSVKKVSAPVHRRIANIGGSDRTMSMPLQTRPKTDRRDTRRTKSVNSDTTLDQKGRRLRHLTKSRAKGPKRRLPRGITN